MADPVVADDASEFVALLRRATHRAADPANVAARSSDADDDYLIALAEGQQAFLVSGDGHVLELRETLPVLSPREFLDRLLAESRR